MTTQTTPCDGHWYVYDVLIDGGADTATYQYAQDEATTLCGACPIRDQCHADNAGEPWVAAMSDEASTVNWHEPTYRPTCGSIAGVSAHRYWQEWNCAACRKAAARTRWKQRRAA